MTLKEIAERINAHLKEAEADPIWNRRTWESKGETRELKRLYNAGAHPHGRFVAVTFVSYQGSTSLSKKDALAYLQWLDEGNRGSYYQFERSIAE